VLAVSGCFAQAFPEKAKALGADVLMGTGNRKQTVAAVEEFLSSGKPQVLFRQLKDAPYEHMEADELLEHTRAFLKIEEGCERY
jgi:threonylcarbamoyladenosine tRNA methylthiotransferase MtaB